MGLLAFSAAGIACASQLIINGGFETGSLSGWTVTSEAGSYPGSGFFASNSTTTPQSSSPTVGPESGSYYAVSDSQGPGTLILSQTFTVPAGAASVILSFGLFVNSDGGDVVNTVAGLDFSGTTDPSDPANQYGVVSLLSSGASLFSTTAGVLGNFYEGTDNPMANPNPYTNYTDSITSLVEAGGTFTLRFAEVNNIEYLNMGVDNVSVVYTATTATPEPSSIVLTLAATGAIWVGMMTLGQLNLLRFRQRKDQRCAQQEERGVQA
jgi:hypothetical protein